MAEVGERLFTVVFLLHKFDDSTRDDNFSAYVVFLILLRKTDYRFLDGWESVFRCGLIGELGICLIALMHTVMNKAHKSGDSKRKEHHYNENQVPRHNLLEMIMIAPAAIFLADSNHRNKIGYGIENDRNQCVKRGFELNVMVSVYKEERDDGNNRYERMHKQKAASHHHKLKSGSRSKQKYCDKEREGDAGNTRECQINDPSRQVIILLSDSVNGKGNAHRRGKCNEHIR